MHDFLRQLEDQTLENVLTVALEKGFRHIDTGFSYGNEEMIGKILKQWFDKGGKREDVFITSKVSRHQLIQLIQTIFLYIFSFIFTVTIF